MFLTKKIAALIFSLGLVAPSFFMWSWFQIQQSQHRKEVKHLLIEGVPLEQLSRLAFKTNQLDKLEWKHSREFRFDGEMYDIVESESYEDSTIFWCWWDHEETALYQELEQMLALHHREPNNDDPVNQSWQQFKKVQQPLDIQLPSPHFEFIFNKLKLKQNLAQLSLATDTPPPQCTVV